MTSNEAIYDKSMAKLKKYIHNSVKLDLYNNLNMEDAVAGREKFLVASIDTIEKYIKAVKDDNLDISHVIFVIEDTEKGYITSAQCQKLLELRSLVREKGSDIKIFDMDLFSIEDVVYANQQMDTVTDQINSARVLDEGNRKLTQYEKFIWAYTFVANRAYKESVEDLGMSRNITSIFKNNQIVCVGFAMLLQEMCRRLGIECYKNSCEVFPIGESSGYGHANNIVILDNQPYISDACFDSITEKNSQVSYNYCLIPTQDLDLTKKFKMNNHVAPFQNIERDMKIAKKLLRQIQEKKDFTPQDYSKLLCDNMIYHSYKELVKPEPEPDYNNIADIAEYFASTGKYKEKAVSWLNKVIDKIGQKHTATPYEFTDFEQAMKNIYVSKGMTRSKARDKVDDILAYTTKRAGEQFEEGAQNSFASRYYKVVNV